MIELARLLTSFDFEKAKIFGDEYIPEYAWIELDRLRRERSYQIYIATAAEIATYNMAHREEMRYLTVSYNDLLSNKEPQEEKHEQTIEEIKEKQKTILNKLFRGGGKK